MCSEMDEQMLKKQVPTVPWQRGNWIYEVGLSLTLGKSVKARFYMFLDEPPLTVTFVFLGCFSRKNIRLFEKYSDMSRIRRNIVLRSRDINNNNNNNNNNNSSSVTKDFIIAFILQEDITRWEEPIFSVFLYNVLLVPRRKCASNKMRFLSVFRRKNVEKKSCV